MGEGLKRIKRVRNNTETGRQLGNEVTRPVPGVILAFYSPNKKAWASGTQANLRSPLFCGQSHSYLCVSQKISSIPLFDDSFLH